MEGPIAVQGFFKKKGGGFVLSCDGEVQVSRCDIMAFVSTARPRVLPLPSMQSVSVTCMSKGEKEESGAILDDQDASKKDPLYLGVETWVRYQKLQTRSSDVSGMTRQHLS